MTTNNNSLTTKTKTKTNKYSQVSQSDDTDITDNTEFFDLKLGIEQVPVTETKLKQISMGALCYKMFKKNMKKIFVFNMGLNILLCSIMIPTLFKLSNDYFVSNDNSIGYGILCVCMGICCQIISTIHTNFIIEPYKREFIGKVHCDLEEEVNKKILQINWNKLRELNKNDLDRKKDAAKFYLLGLINGLINTFISLFSFFGYTFWVGLISPISLVVYIGLLTLLIIYYPYKNYKNSNNLNKLWANYWNKQTGLFTNIIHLKGHKILKEMKNSICAIENQRDNDKKSDSELIDSISVIFNLGFIINCLLVYYFTNTNLTTSNIIIYIQYSCLMRNSVSMCIGVYTQYSDSQREYKKLEEIIDSSDKRNEIDQINNYSNITIKSLEYIYPQDSSESNKPFKLILDSKTKLFFKLGQNVKLEGDSGHGKSTFSDIFNGIIPHSEYNCDIYLDFDNNVIGFDVLTQSRYYNEQTESICWKPSVYEIITGKTLEYDDQYNLLTDNIDSQCENTVWEALTICSCLDFLKRDNVTNKLKWIHTKNIGMSGGQKGRVCLARTVYRIMTWKPKIVTLDEVDKSIQSEMVVKIMSNILDYTRANNILTFAICHNPDVKNLNKYDQVIWFTDGIITQG